MSAYLLGTDILGLSDSDTASLRQAFGIAHGVGKGVLSAFGMGKVADVLEPLEQQAGLLEKPAPAPTAKPAGAKAAPGAAGATSTPAVPTPVSPTPMTSAVSIAEKSRAVKWPWYVGGGVLAVGVVSGLVVLLRR